MPRLSTTAAAVAGALLVGGLVLAYAQRDAGSPVAAVVVLSIGTLLAAVSALAGVLAARNPAGLSWPEGLAGSWPTSSWWWVVGAAGAVDVLAGPLVSGWLGAVGVLLVGAALIGLGRDLRAPASVGRGTVRAALRLRSASAGNAEQTAAMARIGTGGARVVVFDDRGRLADVVVLDPETGELAAALAGLELVPASELHPPLRTG